MCVGGPISIFLPRAHSFLQYVQQIKNRSLCMYFLDKNRDFSSAQIFCPLSYSRTIAIDSPKFHPFVCKWKELNYCRKEERFWIETSVLLILTAGDNYILGRTSFSRLLIFWILSIVLCCVATIELTFLAHRCLLHFCVFRTLDKEKIQIFLVVNVISLLKTHIKLRFIFPVVR
jgi:hypothetical protein